jgi:hypothetical protein
MPRELGWVVQEESKGQGGVSLSQGTRGGTATEKKTNFTVTQLKDTVKKPKPHGKEKS